MPSVWIVIIDHVDIDETWNFPDSSLLGKEIIEKVYAIMYDKKQ